jgi:flagellar hook assembly protein FlgD
LAGRTRYENTLAGLAGQQTLRWDGTDQDGRRVPPGLYLLEINVSGDSGDESVQQIISVVF